MVPDEEVWVYTEPKYCSRDGELLAREAILSYNIYTGEKLNRLQCKSNLPHDIWEQDSDSEGWRKLR